MSGSGHPQINCSPRPNHLAWAPDLPGQPASQLAPTTTSQPISQPASCHPVNPAQPRTHPHQAPSSTPKSLKNNCSHKQTQPASSVSVLCSCCLVLLLGLAFHYVGARRLTGSWSERRFAALTGQGTALSCLSEAAPLAPLQMINAPASAKWGARF